MKTITLAVAILISGATFAQELPQPSPGAKVEQRVGLTDFSVKYSRPSVKEREIYGALVPYNELWRAGANAATVISINDDVTVGGQALKAGEYALFIKPTADGKWSVIFNTVTDSWGTGEYKEENNAAVIVANAADHSAVESLRYSFENITGETADLMMCWEKKSVSVSFKVDVEAKAWKNIDKALAEATDENKWRVQRNAANFCAETGKELEKGLAWINASIKAKDTWYSYWVKADVLAASGDKKAAIEAANKSIASGEASAKAKNETFGYKDRLLKAIEGWK